MNFKPFQGFVSFDIPNEDELVEEQSPAVCDDHDLEVWAIALHGIYESFFWRGGELVELVSSSFYT